MRGAVRCWLCTYLPIFPQPLPPSTARATTTYSCAPRFSTRGYCSPSSELDSENGKQYTANHPLHHMLHSQNLMLAIHRMASTNQRGKWRLPSRRRLRPFYSPPLVRQMRTSASRRRAAGAAVRETASAARCRRARRKSGGPVLPLEAGGGAGGRCWGKKTALAQSKPDCGNERNRSVAPAACGDSGRAMCRAFQAAEAVCRSRAQKK